jgi:fibronectin type 3 domain-containing protein
MKLLTLATLLSASLLIFNGCATSPVPQKEIPVDATLPMVELTPNGVVADMNAIAFEWKSIKDPRVDGIYIYKIDPDSKRDSDSGESYYDKIDGRYATHYTDQRVEPNTNYRYYFRTFSKDSKSAQGRLIGVKTLDVFDSVSWIYSVTDMPRSAKIIWRPHANEKVEYYLLERKAVDEDKYIEVGRVKGRLNVEFIDTDLKDNHIYTYRLFAVTYDGIKSKSSEIVKVVTKPLPESVTNIQVTRNLPRSVKVTWDESHARDFYQYYLYKAENFDGQYELVAKLFKNEHLDKFDEDGKNYFYRVSVVDKDGLESKHDAYTAQGSSLEKSLAPAIVASGYKNNMIELTWNNLDPRNTNFIVSREERVGWFEELHEDFRGLRSQTFVDRNLKPNTTYIYKVYGVDKYNIMSQASAPVTIVTPETAKANPVQNRQVPQEVQIRAVENVETQEENTIIPLENLDLKGI